MMKKYKLIDFETITFNGFDFSIPEETVQLISMLSMEVGSPTYIKTPVFQKKDNTNNVFVPSSAKQISVTTQPTRKRRGNKNSDITNDDWETIRSFQVTNIEQHIGVDAEMDKIRNCLNKLTDKTFTDMKTQIIDILNSLEDISTEEMTRIGNIIFEIASNNKFYSKLYADIYTELIRSFDIMKQIFQVNYNTYLLLFDNIEYIDSEKDYNKFCIINKQNESRRAISTFFINLSLNGIIDSKNILSILKNLLESVLSKIKQENNKNEVDELTENIAILYNKNIIQLFEKQYQSSINDCAELYVNGGDTIVQTIKKLSEIKVKCYPSMSSKTIFKFMDMV
jgi:hypothetical protein